jgi:hypothetical protein
MVFWTSSQDHTGWAATDGASRCCLLQIAEAISESDLELAIREYRALRKEWIKDQNGFHVAGYGDARDFPTTWIWILNPTPDKARTLFVVFRRSFVSSKFVRPRKSIIGTEYFGTIWQNRSAVTISIQTKLPHLETKAWETDPQHLRGAPLMPTSAIQRAEDGLDLDFFNRTPQFTR